MQFKVAFLFWSSVKGIELFGELMDELSERTGRLKVNRLDESLK